MIKNASLLILLVVGITCLMAEKPRFNDMTYLGNQCPVSNGGFVYYEQTGVTILIQKHVGMLSVRVMIAKDKDDVIIGRWLNYRVYNYDGDLITCQYADVGTAGDVVRSFAVLKDKIDKLANVDDPYYEMEIRLTDELSIVYDESFYNPDLLYCFAPHICFRGKVVLDYMDWENYDKLIEALKNVH